MTTVTLRALIHAPMRFALIGFSGGLFLFMVEAIGRIVVLRESFNSTTEALLYAAYVAPVVLLASLFGLVFGVMMRLTGGAFTIAKNSMRFLPRGVSALVAFPLTAIVLGVLAWAMLTQAPVRLKQNIADLSWRIQSGFFPGLDPLGNHSRAFFIIALGLIGIGLLSTDRLLASTKGSRASSVFLFVLSISGVILVHLLDAGVEFARYEGMFHIPAALLQLGLAFLAASFAYQAITLQKLRLGAHASSVQSFWLSPETPPGSARFQRAGFLGANRVLNTTALGSIVVGLLLLFVGVCVFDFLHIGGNQNVKFLLWRRAVVGHRAYQLASVLSDSDGDGFSRFFDSGELDDQNPAVNPYASELPGNGVEENCVGWDLASGRLDGNNKTTAAEIEPASNGLNFILIAIDTLRADRMSCYGYKRPTTPRLTELAGSARFFERALSVATSTGPSFAALQRSATRGAVFDDTRPTLFGRLERAGYMTAQINAASDETWLRKPGWAHYRRTLLDGVRSFVHDRGEERWNADRVTDAGIGYLESLPAGTKHATWVHYLDPHEPRKKMEPFDFGNSDSDLYDSEIAFTDREVGRLLDWLRASGALDRSIVVLMSDHGESFGEHGMTLHGNRTYDEQLHVPLMIWAPGLIPAHIAQPVSLVDIAPTVLEFLGMEEIPGAEGQNLLGSTIENRSLLSEVDVNYANRSIFAYTVFFPYALTDGNWRLIHDLRGNTWELYDLAVDPREVRNLADLEPDQFARLKRELVQRLENSASPVDLVASAW